MSKLTFTLSLSATEWLRSDDLPVEIRKSNMALVVRTLASQSVEVVPGTYYITTTLPAGQEISRVVEVKEGADETVFLTPDPKENFTARRPETWPHLSATSSSTLSMGFFNSINFLGLANYFDFPRRESILKNVEVEAATRPRGGVARGRDEGEKTFVRRGVEARLRAFNGNILQGECYVADAFEVTGESRGDVIQLSVEGRTHGQLAQLLQPNRPAINITLPASVGEPCELALTPLSNGRYSMEARLSHPTANLLMRYLEQGLWQNAADVAESPSLNAENLLQKKRSYPIAAALGAYALLRFGELERLHDWTNNLKNWFEWLPDGITIRGEHLALRGEHEEALEVFCALPERGLPYFSDGLSYAVNRLRLYTSLDEKSFKPEKVEQARSILERLERFVPYINFRKPVITYAGLDPSRPDSEFSTQEAANYGGLNLARFRAPKEYVLGIDLGDRRSSVAVMEEGEPVVIEVDGSTVMPSAIAFTYSGDRLVGLPALRRMPGVRQFSSGPIRAFKAFIDIDDIRKLLGRRYEDILRPQNKKAQKVTTLAGFRVLPDEEGNIRLKVSGRSYRPQELLAMIVQKLKRSAESYLGREAAEAVISIPAAFNSAQRQALREACEIAGLKVLRMSSEPVLSALALKSDAQGEGNVAILNLGSGTSDISILRVGPDFIKTLATVTGPGPGVFQTGEYLRNLAATCEAALREAELETGELDEIVLSPRPVPNPDAWRMVEQTLGRKPLDAVADELVAIGAALYGAVLKGEREAVRIDDVLPLSLGIETLGGVNMILIPRNTTIPTRKSEIFSTASDNQTSVEVNVLQGERPMAGDNRTLGKFHLVGIPPAPRGMPQVEVTFDIDANGIVNVSAKDMGTGREQKITITASSGLSKEEIDKMMRDAESHSAEDAQRREEVEARNRLDGLVFQIEKTLGENKEKLDGAMTSQVEGAIAEAKKALEEGGAERLNNAFQNLQTASHKLAEALYQSGGVVSAAVEEEAMSATAAEGSAVGDDEDAANAGYIVEE